MWVQSLSWEDHLEEEMAIHSSILAWKIPWTEEPGGLQSTVSQRAGHDCSHLVVSNSLGPHGLWTARVFCPWDFPGKNTGVGFYLLLKGIFPTQGSNPRRSFTTSTTGKP